MPNERQILFSSEMVLAILEERKFQTRRVMFPSHAPPVRVVELAETPRRWQGEWDECYMRMPVTSPYGDVGDRLWVRETWRPDWAVAPGGLSGPGIAYKADGTVRGIPQAGEKFPQECQVHNQGRWRPSIHMPRWASRITLEVTGLRVERLWDITPDDVEAEGIVIPWHHRGELHSPERWKHDHFKPLWNRINDDRGHGWDSNPWVFVVEFIRVK